MTLSQRERLLRAANVVVVTVPMRFVGAGMMVGATSR
jgi:hypothetical protein